MTLTDEEFLRHIATARNQALEEAARVVEAASWTMDNEAGTRLAAAIRALASSSTKAQR